MSFRFYSEREKAGRHSGRDGGLHEFPSPAGRGGGLQPPPGAQPDHRHADPPPAQAPTVHCRHPRSVRQCHDARLPSGANLARLPGRERVPHRLSALPAAARCPVNRRQPGARCRFPGGGLRQHDPPAAVAASCITRTGGCAAMNSRSPMSVSMAAISVVADSVRHVRATPAARGAALRGMSAQSGERPQRQGCPARRRYRCLWVAVKGRPGRRGPLAETNPSPSRGLQQGSDLHQGSKPGPRAGIIDPHVVRAQLWSPADAPTSSRRSQVSAGTPGQSVPACVAGALPVASAAAGR